MCSVRNVEKIVFFPNGLRLFIELVVVVAIGRTTFTRGLYLFKTFIFIVAAVAASAVIVVRIFYLFNFFFLPFNRPKLF